jgi:hypothetical protein
MLAQGLKWSHRTGYQVPCNSLWSGCRVAPGLRLEPWPCGQVAAVQCYDRHRIMESLKNTVST